MTKVYKGPYRTMKQVYFSLPEGTPVQLINNVLVMTPVFFSDHAYLRGEIGIEMHSFVKKNKKGRVIVPLHDILLDDENIFQPDITYYASEYLNRLHESGTHGTPDLVIEILSPGTAQYDLNEKKAVYERCGITEYRIIDPADKSTKGYFLTGDKYQEFFKSEGLLESKLLVCKIEF